MKAFVYNSVSDVCLLAFTSIYFKAFGSFHFPTDHSVFMASPNLMLGWYTPTMVCLVVSSSCKSAQFMFHFWLPDSMDAPAPASALIHSATLVAAGVFLLLRSRALIFSNSLLVMLSLVTVCVGGLSAAYQTDLKKILAYSTISNCGFMVYFAVSNTNLCCFLFFMSHGLLKAASFIIVGFLIIKMSHKQDFRHSGNILGTDHFLFVSSCLTIGSLGGLPLSTMYYVKHSILAGSQFDHIQEPFVNFCISVGILTSATYSLKIITLPLMGNSNKAKPNFTTGDKDLLLTKIAISATISLFLVMILITTVYFTNNVFFMSGVLLDMSNCVLPTDFFYNQLIHEPSSTNSISSGNFRSALLLCYTSTLLLVSFQTWSPNLQNGALSWFITLPIVLLATVFM